VELELRSKWKRLAGFALIWTFVLFPIPFLPLWGYNINPEAFQTVLIIAAIITVPLALLFIFMK
jgi:hypothetical protein